MAALSSADAVIDALKGRLTSLEVKVRGSKAGSPVGVSSEAPITAQVLSMHAIMQDLAAKHTKVTQMWAQYASIEKSLSRQNLDDAALATPIKEELIVAGAEMVAETAKQLEDLDKLKGNVNTQALEDLPDLKPKLHPLEAIHVQQQEECDRMNNRLTHLLTFYNDLMLLLSKKFVYWDHLLSHAERQVNELIAQRE